MNTQPLVSIVTPVYNNAEYLEECIESVVDQTYKNWDYVIVDNCSSDASGAIARKFARQDKRIRVITNDTFLPIIANHNHAIRQISAGSRFCKFVFADDWLFPSCIQEMVEVAVGNPSVGLVGSYTTDGEAVLWAGPPYPCLRASGWEVCRTKLLGGPYVYGTMTSLLVRSDLIRKRRVFFNELNLHADNEACFELLKESDFAFVHQVLSYSRRRPDSNSSVADDFDSVMLGEYLAQIKFGPVFLKEEEYRQSYSRVRKEYYRVLARGILKMRRKGYWEYHKRTLRSVDTRLSVGALLAALIPEVMSCLSHPAQSISHGKKWLSRALSRSKLGRFANSNG